MIIIHNYYVICLHIIIHKNTLICLLSLNIQKYEKNIELEFNFIWINR